MKRLPLALLALAVLVTGCASTDTPPHKLTGRYAVVIVPPKADPTYIGEFANFPERIVTSIQQALSEKLGNVAYFVDERPSAQRMAEFDAVIYLKIDTNTLRAYTWTEGSRDVEDNNSGSAPFILGQINYEVHRGPQVKKGSVRVEGRRDRADLGFYDQVFTSSGVNAAYAITRTLSRMGA
jgi:hypothetical protein